MEMLKRIEIIAFEHEVPRLLKALDQAGVPGYSVINNVTGKTASAMVDNDLTFAGLGNVYILCCCKEELLAGVIDAITPLLNTFGGVCYISEVMALGIVHSWSKSN